MAIRQRITTLDYAALANRYLEIRTMDGFRRPLLDFPFRVIKTILTITIHKHPGNPGI